MFAYTLCFYLYLIFELLLVTFVNVCMYVYKFYKAAQLLSNLVFRQKWNKTTRLLL